MEWIVTKCMVAAGCQLEVSAALIGEDVLLCLQGGERPHLGCVVQTEPRVSLSGDGCGECDFFGFEFSGA